MATWEAFMLDEGNQTCADCGKAETTYLASEFAVLLCEKCAEAHQFEHLSTVIAVADQPALPAFGGNRSFHTYLTDFNIDNSAPAEFKYRIQASGAYKAHLAAGQDPLAGERLPLEEALLLQDSAAGPGVTEVLWGAVEVAKNAKDGLYEGLNDFTKTPTMKWVEESTLGWLEGFETRFNSYFVKPEQSEEELHPV